MPVPINDRPRWPWDSLELALDCDANSPDLCVPSLDRRRLDYSLQFTRITAQAEESRWTQRWSAVHEAMRDLRKALRLVLYVKLERTVTKSE